MDHVTAAQKASKILLPPSILLINVLFGKVGSSMIKIPTGHSTLIGLFCYHNRINLYLPNNLLIQLPFLFSFKSSMVASMRSLVPSISFLIT